MKYQTLISADDLRRIMADRDVVVIDCRFYLDDILKGRKEYLQHHIPKAVYLDITNDLSSAVIRGVTGRHPLPHPEILSSTLRSVGVNNTSQVIAYDQSNGAFAARLWWLMNWLGHKDVAVLDGGYPAWLNADREKDNQWPLPDAGDFTYNLQSDLVIDKEHLHGFPLSLVDSREYKRYSGEFEPIDPVAGHIEGAVCMPFMENTHPSGLWKGKTELAERFEALDSDKPVVFYCGSGVTACHNILAYKIATGNDAKLYAGSWSEWINYHKPSRPEAGTR